MMRGLLSPGSSIPTALTNRKGPWGFRTENPNWNSAAQGKVYKQQLGERIQEQILSIAQTEDVWSNIYKLLQRTVTQRKEEHNTASKPAESSVPYTLWKVVKCFSGLALSKQNDFQLKKVEFNSLSSRTPWLVQSIIQVTFCLLLKEMYWVWNLLPPTCFSVKHVLLQIESRIKQKLNSRLTSVFQTRILPASLGRYFVL